MASGKLFTYTESFRAWKILIAAEYSGAKITKPDFVFGETNKSEEFLKKFPTGKVPAFEADDGTCVFESNAIAYYVGNKALRGATEVDAAHVLQWINFADSDILPAACAWLYPVLGIMQYNKQNTERAKEDIKRALSALNRHLTTRTYLVGERISLADITVACELLQLYKKVLDSKFREPFSHVNRWFMTLVNQPQFKSVLGEVTLCKTMAQFDVKKFQEMQELTGQKKPKAAQKKEQAKPKAEKPKQEKAAEEEAPKPKPSKDPFAALPEGTFVMDDWKKMYSNNDTLKVALPYFWKNFDHDNYSIWFCEYKYPKDLSMIFMSCNLIGGMFQRLDRMRKHAFGSVLLFGEDDNSTISGVWCWRGQELAFELSEDLKTDYITYDWKKLDSKSEETKEIVQKYFAWEGDFGGQKLNQGKVFK